MLPLLVVFEAFTFRGFEQNSLLQHSEVAKLLETSQIFFMTATPSLVVDIGGFPQTSNSSMQIINLYFLQEEL